MLARAFSVFPALRSEPARHAAVPVSAAMTLSVPGFLSEGEVLLPLSCSEFSREVNSEQFPSQARSGTQNGQKGCRVGAPVKRSLHGSRGVTGREIPCG